MFVQSTDRTQSLKSSSACVKEGKVSLPAMVLMLPNCFIISEHPNKERSFASMSSNWACDKSLMATKSWLVPIRAFASCTTVTAVAMCLLRLSTFCQRVLQESDVRYQPFHQCQVKVSDPDSFYQIWFGLSIQFYLVLPALSYNLSNIMTQDSWDYFVDSWQWDPNKNFQAHTLKVTCLALPPFTLSRHGHDHPCAEGVRSFCHCNNEIHIPLILILCHLKAANDPLQIYHDHRSKPSFCFIFIQVGQIQSSFAWIWKPQRKSDGT